MNRKGFSPLIVIGIVGVILVIGVAGYLAWNTSTQANLVPAVQHAAPATSGANMPTFATSSVALASTTYTSSSSPAPTYSPPQTASTQPYAGWQAYTNGADGFEILYPPQYKAQVSDANSATVDINLVSDPLLQPLVSVEYFSGTTPAQVPFAFLMAIGPTLSMSQMAQSLKQPFVSISTETAMVDNFKAQAAFITSESKTANNEAVYVFAAQGRVYGITAVYGTATSTVASNRALAEKIIDTFKPVADSL